VVELHPYAKATVAEQIASPEIETRRIMKNLERKRSRLRAI
jgi:hypothetical protein